MKGGVAVQLRLAAAVTEPTRDLTFVFYDCEEIEAELNGLARLARHRPELLAGDFAVLLEPTDGAGRGRLQGHPAGRGHRPRGRRPLGPPVERATTPSTTPAGARPAGGLRGPDRRGRRPRLPRGAERRRHQAAASPATSSPTAARSRSTTATRRQDRRGGARPRARGLRRATTCSVDDVGRRRPARACTCPRPRRSSRRSGCRSRPRRAGPTSRASPRSASRP